MSKTSKRRPQFVTNDEFAQRWATAFGEPSSLVQCRFVNDCPDGACHHRDPHQYYYDCEPKPCLTMVDYCDVYDDAECVPLGEVSA